MAYVVKTACAKMPSSVKGTYRRVAVLEVDPGTEPIMISERARGVRRIVHTWDRLNVGTTDRCAYRVALVEAEKMAADLNNA